MLCVRGEVTLIWRPVTYPIANPNIPPRVIRNQKCRLKKNTF